MEVKRAQHENEEPQKRQPNIENRCGLCRGHIFGKNRMKILKVD